MESLINKFEAAVAPGLARVAPGMVIASATVKGAFLYCSLTHKASCPVELN
jgi:hypothetical protein